MNDLTALLAKHSPAPFPLTESTPQLYGLLFYLIHPDQIEGYDPRTAQQIADDEFDAEVRATRESDRPF